MMDLPNDMLRPDAATVQALETLAKLSLTPKERECFAQDLALLTRFAVSLPDVGDDTASAGNTAWEGLRPDIPRPSLARDELLDGAPRAEDGYLLVPAVMGGTQEEEARRNADEPEPNDLSQKGGMGRGA